jgi:FecR-like protein
VPARQKPELHVAWVTITYRSVALSIVFLALIVGGIMYFAFPDTTQAGITKFGGWFDHVFSGRSGTTSDKKPAGPQHANFTSIDGTVRVKKASSNTWVTADYNLPLDEGDVVQTGSEGIAKVVFADGTNYTVKQDSLIVIEHNSTNAAQQTDVAVQVTTGTVDLSTASFSTGSKSEVKVAGATASLSQLSSAQVHNDPRGDQHEILLKTGSGEVQRNGETVKLGSYDRVTFTADAPHMTRIKDLSPPTLITPANMTPVFSGPGMHVDFSWTPVENTRGYHVRVSKNPYFSSVVYDKIVTGTDLQLSNIPEGAYYWLVQSVSTSNNKESIESEKNRFTVVPKGRVDVALALEIDLIQQGHVIEIEGKTEPGARVMVNGEEVPVVRDDGSFNYFTPPLPVGPSIITITAQNKNGGVNTQQKKVLIQ